MTNVGRFFLRAGTVLLLGVFLVCSQMAFADSPITSSTISDAYADVAIVAKAKSAGTIDQAMMEFLSNDKNPIDVKVAVVNALGWSVDGNKTNAATYKSYLEGKYKVSGKALLNKMSPAEQLSLGYMTVMDDYFSPTEALPLLRRAVSREGKSFTFAIIFALVKAQDAMEDDFSKVWKVMDRVFKNKNLRDDMRPQAKDIILKYAELYKKTE
ncbi:MAG: hypothetical protein WA705_12720 [Candidatus Ozemobacteraceae bacterium]